jgi:hypothetical protein
MNVILHPVSRLLGECPSITGSPNSWDRNYRNIYRGIIKIVIERLQLSGGYSDLNAWRMGGVVSITGPREHKDRCVHPKICAPAYRVQGQRKGGIGR